MTSLGDIYRLTMEELKIYGDKIKSALLRFIQTSDLSSLVLFIVWSYEYLEAYASTDLSTNAKKSKKSF